MSPFLLHPAHFAAPSTASLCLRPPGAVCGCLVVSPPLFNHHCCTGITSPPTPTPPLMILGKAKALIPGK